MYLLVEFTDNNEVAVIPDNWLDGNSCAVWPTHIRMTSRLNAAVKHKTAPGNSWPALPIRELYRSVSYDAVRSKLKRAEMESDLGTTAISDSESDDCRRSKRRIRTRVFSSDEDDEEQTHFRRTTRPSTAPSSSVTGNAVLVPHEPLPQPPTGIAAPTGSAFGRSPGARPCYTPEHPAIPRARTSIAPTGSAFEQAPGAEQLATPPAASPPAATPLARTSIARDIRLFTMLEKMVQKQAKMEESLGQVLAYVRVLAEGATADMPEGLALPVSSVEELHTLEEQLAEESTHKALVNHLSFLGGKDLSDSCRRVMSYCITSDLAMQFNWNGLKEKREFGKLRLAAAVLKSVMKSRRCTASEVKDKCCVWMRTASDRNGGRKRRRDKRQRQLAERQLAEHDNALETRDEQL